MKKNLILAMIVSVAVLTQMEASAKGPFEGGFSDNLDEIVNGTTIGASVGVGAGVVTVVAPSYAGDVLSIALIPVVAGTMGASVGAIVFPWIKESANNREILLNMQNDAGAFLAGENASPLLQDGIRSLREQAQANGVQADLSDRGLALALVKANF